MGQLAKAALAIHATACIDTDVVAFDVRDGNACVFSVGGDIQGTCRKCPFIVMPRAPAEAGASDASADALARD
jgi:hypothetical protein